VYAGRVAPDRSTVPPRLLIALQRRPYRWTAVEYRRRPGPGDVGRHPGNLDPRPGGV